MDKSLTGVKVLDLTHYIAGPYCTKMLADYGAEVIKIERPGTGDRCRRLEPLYHDESGVEKSGFFLYLNTNKKSITLNLKAKEGRTIFKNLIQDTDILVENFHPRVMAGLGLDYSCLEKINSKLIMVSISNFGHSGPYRDFKASEVTLDAMGGWSALIGHADREPLKPGGNQAQFVSGLFGSIGAVSAFYGRNSMGTGQHVDISIMEAVLFIQMNITSRYDYDEIITKRWGNHVDPLPGSILPCKDGYIGAITVTQEKWVTLCEWMGKPELVEDPRFKTAENRASYADDLDNILRAWLINYTEEELLKEGQKRRLPFGIPLSTEKLLKSGHLNERGYFVEVEHPATGKILYPGPQIRMGELPYELKRAPLLGEHNEEIYCGQMGFSTEDLEKMKEQGII